MRRRKMEKKWMRSEQRGEETRKGDEGKNLWKEKGTKEAAH